MANPDIDEELLNNLNYARRYRNEALEYAEALNDRAALMRIEAEKLEEQAKYTIDQLNEDVPSPADKPRK